MEGGVESQNFSAAGAQKVGGDGGVQGEGANKELNFLIKEVAILTRRVDDLESDKDALKSENKALKARLAELERKQVREDNQHVNNADASSSEGIGVAEEDSEEAAESPASFVNPLQSLPSDAEQASNARPRDLFWNNLPSRADRERLAQEEQTHSTDNENTKSYWWGRRH